MMQGMKRSSKLLSLVGGSVATLLVAFGLASLAGKFDPVAMKSSEVSPIEIADGSGVPCVTGGGSGGNRSIEIS